MTNDDNAIYDSATPAADLRKPWVEPQIEFIDMPEAEVFFAAFGTTDMGFYS